MAHAETKRLQGGKIALALAGLAALGAIGYAISREPSPAAEAEAQDPIAALRKRAAADPDDPQALLALGDALFNAGRFTEAIDAFAGATKAAPDAARAWSALGEATVMASERDPLPPEALAAFRRAAAIDATDPRARYFLAVHKDLAGDHAGAIGDWLALLEDTPPGAPWRSDLVRTIEQVGTINRIAVTEDIAAAQQGAALAAPVGHPALPGPTARDLAAASALPPSEQRTMAEAMVARLEARLKAEPANLDGWVMLIRSRMTLGEPAKATRALNDAVAANPARVGELRAAAGDLGVR